MKIQKKILITLAFVVVLLLLTTKSFGSVYIESNLKDTVHENYTFCTLPDLPDGVNLNNSKVIMSYSNGFVHLYVIPEEFSDYYIIAVKTQLRRFSLRSKLDISSSAGKFYDYSFAIADTDFKNANLMSSKTWSSQTTADFVSGYHVEIFYSNVDMYDNTYQPFFSFSGSGNTGGSTTGGDETNTTPSGDTSIDYSDTGVFSWIAKGIELIAKILNTILNPLEGILSFLNPFSENFIFKDFFSWLNPLSENFILLKLWDFFTTLLDYLNPFSENFILLKLWDFFITLLDYLNPFSENFILLKLWDFLTTVISYINPFSDNFLGKKIVELFSDLLQFLFVPSNERLDSLISSVKSHFTFIDTIHNTSNIIKDMFNNTESLPKISINISQNKWYSGNVITFDLSWYAPYKQYGDLVISAFIYVFFLWRTFIKLPGIISGTAGDVTELHDISLNIKKGGRK